MLDVDIEILLDERGRGGGVKGGNLDNGISDRALEQTRRISGADMLHDIFVHVIDALRNGGWTDSQPLTARVEQDVMGDGKTGRDWSLRGALSKATIVAPATEPNARHAEQCFYDENHPEQAIVFTQTENSLVVTMYYISDGNAINGADELSGLLRGYGVTVTEGGE